MALAFVRPEPSIIECLDHETKSFIHSEIVDWWYLCDVAKTYRRRKRHQNIFDALCCSATRIATTVLSPSAEDM